MLGARPVDDNVGRLERLAGFRIDGWNARACDAIQIRQFAR